MNHEYIKLMQSSPELFTNSREPGGIDIITDEEKIRELEEALGRKIGIIYEDEYIRIVRDGVVFPDGEQGTYIRLLPQKPENPVAILPVSAGKILLLRHFRHSLRRWVWEIPRGFGEHGLTASENAAKELWEETGVRAKTFEYLGRICPDSGISSDIVAVYYTEFVPEPDMQKQDEREAVGAFRMAGPDELKMMVEEGTMTDGFTLSAIALARMRGKLRG